MTGPLDVRVVSYPVTLPTEVLQAAIEDGTFGPYEHTSAYRPDVIAQAEGTEPQWSDAPAECESPEPDLSRVSYPRLVDFAIAVSDEIHRTSITHGRAEDALPLALAAAWLAADVTDFLPGEFVTGTLGHEMWSRSHTAWRRLRRIREAQLTGRLTFRTES